MKTRTHKELMPMRSGRRRGGMTGKREPLERIWLEDVSIAERKAMILQRVKERDLCHHLKDRRPKILPPLFPNLQLVRQTPLPLFHHHPRVPANHVRVITKMANHRAAEARLAGA
ncbi:hypothetical protein SKAU_G00225160 [Synaphobranchus kaupii]|uniref:Uncharacterized protein n=1 Tax=Synaphobranchus kaupii TaxID=118154 RepID=A0A9Q1IVW9_SYNKA|nr:hypothetical protein SKAU_G00225160 [Synaphobranchus kaupii]